MYTHNMNIYHSPLHADIQHAMQELANRQSHSLDAIQQELASIRREQQQQQQQQQCEDADTYMRMRPASQTELDFEATNKDYLVAMDCDKVC